MTDETHSLARPASAKELFVAFTLLALQGFGGVLAVAQRVLCEQKRWLTREQFVEILAFGQVLPGPNVCNVALMVGDRFFGWRGAFAALAGMMTVPLVIVLAVTVVYSQYASNIVVAGALKGMGAVAAGLIVGTALKLSSALRANPMGIPACAALLAGAFAAVAILRWPLVWVLLGLGTLACLLAWRRLGGEGAAVADGR
ncbi:MAG TPA: chromate transporter [Burkholderiales bacterium]|jgi:chromate transporter|nr:chromate transporter [Burkholderiales bacterium]